jgi:predicted dehydrogenase
MLVGAGFGATHLTWLAACKDATVEVLCYRSDEKRARQLAERFEVRRTSTNPFDVIARGNIDMVAVVSPPETHEPILKAALSAGLPVVSDKPLAHDARATARLVDLARRGAPQNRAFVTFQWRHNPAFGRLRELASAGRLGRISGLDLEFHHDFLAGPGTAWPWRHRVAGAGALSDQGVHLLDLLRWINPADWTVVAAIGSVVWPRRTHPGGAAHPDHSADVVGTGAGSEAGTVAGPGAGPGIGTGAGAKAGASAGTGAGSDDRADADAVECEAEDTAEILLRAEGAAAHARVAVSRTAAGRRALRVVVQGTDGVAEVSVNAADGSAGLRVFSGAGEDPPIEFGPHTMNPYPAILRTVGHPMAEVADFADGHAAQVLMEQAMRTGIGKPMRMPADRSEKVAGPR